MSTRAALRLIEAYLSLLGISFTFSVLLFISILQAHPNLISEMQIFLKEEILPVRLACFYPHDNLLVREVIEELFSAIVPRSLEKSLVSRQRKEKKDK